MKNTSQTLVDEFEETDGNINLEFELLENKRTKFSRRDWKKRKIKDSEYQGLRVTTESILKIVKNILSKKLNKMI